MYFPEPTIPDDSFSRCQESTYAWLTRSTNDGAVALREFLNRSLNHFPHRVAKSLAKRLEYDWQAHLFEIQVGRYLQVLGARKLEYEPEGTNGKKVDYRVTFDDGVVSIECHEEVQRRAEARTRGATMPRGPHRADVAHRLAHRP